MNIKFIDLFAGIGGIRYGFQKGFKSENISTECVLTSEIKGHALTVLKDNYEHNKIVGDIRNIKTDDIPDFDFLLAGFPCQAFSTAGNRDGFADTRGTLFFEIERILKNKKPYGFLLENVSNLERHDNGNTFKVMLKNLEKLGYKVSYKVLNAKDFGLAQSRKRIFIVGTLSSEISLDDFIYKKSLFGDVLEHNQPTVNNKLTQLLLKNYEIEELYGKAIKDKRGGNNNIHSWEIELKGKVSYVQKYLLNQLLKQRRRKIWAEKKGIKWMDGMPLTVEEISTFFPDLIIRGKIDINKFNLKEILDDLVDKGYLKLEHPKKQVITESSNGKKIKRRVYDETLPKGYNIVTGKLSFSFSKILNPNDITPTLVATDVSKLAVPDKDGLRELTLKEGLRLFGYDDDFKLNISKNKAFDLLGNTVPVNIIESISRRLAVDIKKSNNLKEVKIDFSAIRK